VYLSRGKVEKGRPFISPITPSAAIVVRSFHAAQEKWRWCLSGIGCRGEGYHDNPLGGRDAAGGDWWWRQAGVMVVVAAASSHCWTRRQDSHHPS